jgi:hypothetical protein
MIGFWDFKLSGAPPLLSFGVGRVERRPQHDGPGRPRRAQDRDLSGEGPESARSDGPSDPCGPSRTFQDGVRVNALAASLGELPRWVRLLPTRHGCDEIEDTSVRLSVGSSRISSITPKSDARSLARAFRTQGDA